MNISKSLLATLLFVASATLAGKLFRTECDEISNGVCYQYCAGGCDLKCIKSDDYTSCEQFCTGGNCNMRCRAKDRCTFYCAAGNCQTAICHARDTCEEFCTGGKCSMECYGNSCEQSCTEGNCQLQCPSGAEKCEQHCTINKDKCTIQYV